MVNLVSFTLTNILLGDLSVGHLLDFFESVPRLREVELASATPTSGAQDGRLVSLGCLERMSIIGRKPPFLLLEHLLIPVGATLTIGADLRSPTIEDHLLKSLDNLKNLPGFTGIYLYFCRWHPRIEFSGPNRNVIIFPAYLGLPTTQSILESLALFDTSKVERLEIENGQSSARDLPYQTLLPMKRLRTLTLSRCQNIHIFTDALQPRAGSEDVVCPELEKLVLVPRSDLEAKDVIGMAVARELRRVKLKSVRIATHDKVEEADVLELKKHVLQVECVTTLASNDKIDEEG